MGVIVVAFGAKSAWLMAGVVCLLIKIGDGLTPGA
jgi:hypothetical protein